MNFPSISIEKLSAINPETVVNYLRHASWYQDEIEAGHHAIWKLKSQKEYIVLLPLNAEIPDFSNRMYDVIRTLSTIEHRPESEIFNDLANVTQIAQDLGREVLNLHLYLGKDQSKPEASAKKLGHILTTLQDTIDAIGQVEGGRATPLGKIAQEITDRTSLDVISLFKGSFGIRLAAAPPSEQLNWLENPPLAETVIGNFIALLNSGSNKAKLSKLMQKYQQRTASRYRKFLIALTDAEADLLVEWGSPNLQKSGAANLSSLDAWRAIEICSELVTNEPEEYEVVGTLWAIDRKRKTFRLEDIYEGKVYFGKIADDVLESDVQMIANPPTNYRARIQAILQENPTTGEASLEYKLTALAPWNKTRPTQEPSINQNTSNPSTEENKTRKKPAGKTTRKTLPTATPRVSKSSTKSTPL
jgi:hypothetical protein